MTLTEVIYYIRRSAPFAVLGVLFFILFYLGFRLLLGRVYTSPKKIIPTLNINFGKVSRLNPSTKINYPPNYSFILDTIEGKPITASDSAKVFFLKQKYGRFGYLQTAYRMAKTFGFDTIITKHRLEEISVIFEDSEKKATIDIADFNFEYKYNYESRPELFQQSALPADTVIRENARQFLRALLKYPDELSIGNQEIIYLNYDPVTTNFAVVKSPQEANSVEVDFFRPDIGTLPVVPPRYFNSQNYVVMVFNKDNYQVIKSQVKYYEKEAENVGVYPLKTGDAAYKLLTDGKGIIVSAGNSSSEITITKMFLGYYDPDMYQDYLQPIYIFLGHNGFAAYVPAIRDEYIE